MRTYRAMVLVSGDPLSLERGAQQVYARLEEEIAAFGLKDEVSLGMVNDIGRHDAAPLVVVYPEAVIYGPVAIDNVHTLVEEHLYKGRVAAGLQAPLKEMTGRIAWLSARKGTLPAEQRIVLERAGVIDPESIEDYIVHDGYQALGKVLTGMTPADVIGELDKSGLRGRGGAGFPTGTKWKFVSKAAGKRKYVICNADESEPGTFKDRLILEGDPHSIIEAMTIAGFAVGASEGYIYIRGEYSLAQERMYRAILKAREMGFLGKNIFDTDFSFDIHIHSGAGAYICGEETALIESIEGKPGIPRARPPFPTTNGLWGMPTLVNNVETLANVPAILRHGATWYRSFGTPSSPGTKVYTMLGNVNVTGVVEVPMGITLREIVTIYAKGMKKGSSFKLAQKLRQVQSVPHRHPARLRYPDHHHRGNRQPERPGYPARIEQQHGSNVELRSGPNGGHPPGGYPQVFPSRSRSTHPLESLPGRCMPNETVRQEGKSASGFLSA